MIRFFRFLLIFFLLCPPAYAEKRDRLAGAAGRSPANRRSDTPALVGAVVRSREYVVHRKPHKVEEFIGNVYYHSGDRELHADWARYDHNSRLWRARGHIEGLLKTKAGSTVRMFGEEAEHDGMTSAGSMKEKSVDIPVSFVREQDGLRDQGTAHRLEWNQNESRAWARGDVHTWGDHGETWAGTAEFQDDKKLLLLTRRRPVVIHNEPSWDGAIQAERIRAFQGQNRMEADESVKGWVLFKNYHEAKPKG